MSDPSSIRKVLHEMSREIETLQDTETVSGAQLKKLAAKLKEASQALQSPEPAKVPHNQVLTLISAIKDIENDRERLEIAGGMQQANLFIASLKEFQNQLDRLQRGLKVEGVEYDQL